MRTRIAVAWLLAAGSLPAADFPHPLESVRHQGLHVDFFASSIQDPDRAAIQAGKEFRLGFKIQDQNGKAVNGAFPAAWIHPRGADETATPELCRHKLQSFLSGSLFAKPALDLNTYRVLTLNDSPSVSVVDPLFGFGGSKLLALVGLPAPGYDWVLSPEQDRIYISIPDTDQITGLDTADWSVNLVGNGNSKPMWHRPGRLALQPDGQYLWLASTEGVAVFERDPLHWLKTLDLDAEVGKADPSAPPKAQVNRAEFAFSPDSRFVFLSRYEQDEVVILDSRDLRVLHRLHTGDGPISMAYSGLSQSLYIAHQGDGRIAVLPISELGADRASKIEWIQSEAGIAQLRISPDGRWGFVINSKTHRFGLLDVADQQMIQQSPTEAEPDQIEFSNDLAYIRHADSETLYLISLDSPAFGRPEQPIPVIDTPGGDHVFGGHAAFTPAPGIVKAPGASAVLIANPGDRAVYFYKEGMAAPMGQFTNYGHAPRAVLAIDRSLREKGRPGFYESVARLDQPGIYDAVFFLDSPRVLHCFSLNVEASEAVAAAPAFSVKAQNQPTRLTVGEKRKLSFRIFSPDAPSSPKGYANIPIDALIALSSGLWRQRSSTQSDEHGSFSLEIAPPMQGYYQIHIQAPIEGLAHNQRPVLTLYAQSERNESKE